MLPNWIARSTLAKSLVITDMTHALMVTQTFDL
jgi:hypothetical protein